jgi:plastocyanin
MNKVLLMVAAGIILVGGAIAGVVIANKDDNKTNNSQTATTNNTQATPQNGDQNTDQSSQTTQANSVEIKDYAFGPNKITVKKGTKVTWTNQDSVKHDVMPDNESDDFVGSGLLAKGQKYEFTFNKVGTYTYHCSPHPYMKATVEVTE